MSSASGSSCFGANFSASFQTRFFRTSGGKKNDRSATTTLRKQASCPKGSTYGEHKIAMLTTRQPQRLPPRGSSDSGSSGSGRSPNSADPGSPPAISATLPALTGYKRPGYYQGADGIETKKQRISHYRKPETSENNVTATTNKPIEQRDARPSFSVLSKSSTSPLSVSSSCPRSNERQRQHSDKQHVAKLPQQPLFGPLFRPNNQTSEADEDSFRSELAICLRMYSRADKDSELIFRNFTNSNSSKSSSARPAVTHNSGCPTRPNIATTNTSTNSVRPDYETSFTIITSEEQNKRYEDEYRSNYKEYRGLYTLVREINWRFTVHSVVFEDEQRRGVKKGNCQKSDEMEQKIKKSMSDPIHAEAKKRLVYLLGKMTHINRLVELWKKSSGLANPRNNGN